MITIAERVDQYAQRIAGVAQARKDYLDGRKTQEQLDFYAQRLDRLQVLAQSLIDLGIDVKAHRAFPEAHILKD
jgi:hypothetical protein